MRRLGRERALDPRGVVASDRAASAATRAEPGDRRGAAERPLQRPVLTPGKESINS